MIAKRIAVLVCLLVLMAACAKPQGSVFFVLFAEAPELVDKAVCDADGIVLAQITQVTVNRDNSARIQITPLPAHKDKFTRDLAFVVTDGRLMATRLSGDADPLSPGSPILGFSSGKSLLWFKLKAMMGNAAAKAAAMAAELDMIR